MKIVTLLGGWAPMTCRWLITIVIVFVPKTWGKLQAGNPPTWRIIPFSKWLITMASKSPKDRIVSLIKRPKFMAKKIGVIRSPLDQVLGGSILQVDITSWKGFFCNEKKALRFLGIFGRGNGTPTKCYVGIIFHTP